MLGSAFALALPYTPVPKSRVVIARQSDLTRNDASQLSTLLDRAMQAFFQEQDALTPWRRLVKPGQIVGLKVNCLAGRGLSTSTLLVELICQRLRSTGVPAGSILIWDRMSQDLEGAGYSIQESTRAVRCFGNDHLGFEPNLSAHGSVGSLLCQNLTRVCDVVINLPVLKDHGITGVTGALKNLFGAIHNPNKYHLDRGDPYIADLWMLPPIREKVRLTILDGLTAQYNGGPAYMPQWTWPYNGILVSQDPVALDQVAWKVLERKRAAMGFPSLREAGLDPSYIARAADRQHRIGERDRIEVVEV
jgi:uncharacterized protein (DUF362 family)